MRWVHIVFLPLIVIAVLALVSVGSRPGPPSARTSQESAELASRAGDRDLVERPPEAQEGPALPSHATGTMQPGEASPDSPEVTPAAPGNSDAGSPRVTLAIRHKQSGDPTTSRVVLLEGRVSPEFAGQRLILRVTGIPVSPGADGQFKVRRSLPRAGEFFFTAVVSEDTNAPGVERTVGVAECRVAVADEPHEYDLLRGLSARVIGPAGEIDRRVFTQLIRTADMRIVPTLWRIIDAKPGDGGIVRQQALWTLGRLLHLGSVPRLIELLRDEGARGWAVGALMSFGLFGEDGVIPSTAERERLIRVLHQAFREREPRLRLEMHQ